MSAQQKQTRLQKLYEILESNYRRVDQWQFDFNKPMPQGSITLALIAVVERNISQLEA